MRNANLWQLLQQNALIFTALIEYGVEVNEIIKTFQIEYEDTRFFGKLVYLIQRIMMLLFPPCFIVSLSQTIMNEKMCKPNTIMIKFKMCKI